MARSFPPDVLVLDSESILHARLTRGKKDLRVAQAKRYPLPEGTFSPAVVTPELRDEAGFTDALRRMKLDGGRIDKVSLLLPDSWFRINIIELPSIPSRTDEAAQVVRWALKRTLPIPPDLLRMSYEPLSRNGQGVKVIVISAVDAALSSVEEMLRRAGIDVVLIEPLGLNIWNAIAMREEDAAQTRLFIYARHAEFTTAVFRGPQPLFIRSRNLSGARSIHQEIRLSASYLRESLETEVFSSCYIAGDMADGDLQSTIASEFNTQVRTVALRDFVEDVPMGLTGHDAELTACTGVFTG